MKRRLPEFKDYSPYWRAFHVKRNLDYGYTVEETAKLLKATEQEIEETVASDEYLIGWEKFQHRGTTDNPFRWVVERDEDAEPEISAILEQMDIEAAAEKARNRKMTECGAWPW